MGFWVSWRAICKKLVKFEKVKNPGLTSHSNSLKDASFTPNPLFFSARFPPITCKTIMHRNTSLKLVKNLLN